MFHCNQFCQNYYVYVVSKFTDCVRQVTTDLNWISFSGVDETECYNVKGSKMKDILDIKWEEWRGIEKNYI
jgi:hypothetical protein